LWSRIGSFPGASKRKKYNSSRDYAFGNPGKNVIDKQNTVIGKVTSDGILRLKEGEKIVGEVPAKSLAEDVPMRYYQGKVSSKLKDIQKLDLENITQPKDYNQTLLKILASPNICSKEWIYKDNKKISVEGTEVILFPGDDAGVLKIKGSKRGIAFTTDGNGNGGN